MKTLLISLLAIFSFAFTFHNDKEENTRYIIIEAVCDPGFNVPPSGKEKVMLTKVFKRTYENAFEMVNAEPDLIIDFEVALEKTYPNQRNHVKDILVYMMNTEKEAKELYKRKIGIFKKLEKPVIELKVK